MRAPAIVCSLGLACASLLGCADNPIGRDGVAMAHQPSASYRLNVRSIPPRSGRNRKTVCAELLRKKLAIWSAGSGRSVSVSALIVDNRALLGRPTSPPPYLEFDDSGLSGHFSATWIGREGGLWAVVRFRRGGGRPIGFGPLLFMWSCSRWRFAWPTGWTRAERRKFRHFIFLGLAGKLPSTVNGINNLLPRPAKILPMRIKLNIAVGPEVPRAQQVKRKSNVHR